VTAAIDAYLASVRVEQQYHNPYAEKIEVVYVFPLPGNAAVSEFLMTIGDRTIRGIIREREEAEQIYREARNMGYVASLLTQERPNIFSQRVANIEPLRDIDITLTYYSTLPYRDGAYQFAFPTVVGPRFNPPGDNDGIGAVALGDHGSSGQPTEVQYLRPDQTSAHRLSLTIDLEAGMPLQGVESSTHAIAVEQRSASSCRISLADGAVVPYRDFVLRYRVAGESVRGAFSVHENDHGTYFTLLLAPPAELASVGRAPGPGLESGDVGGNEPWM
jgi:Ca-activated chloride channel family protein